MYPAEFCIVVNKEKQPKCVSTDEQILLSVTSIQWYVIQP